MIELSHNRISARPIAAIALALLLAACGGSGEEDERTASGEVLEGSISDAMLPLEQVTSQPPPLMVEPTSRPAQDADEADAEAETENSESPGDAPPIADEAGGPE